MKNQESNKLYSLYLMMLLILFQGLSGLYGGFALIVDPTGNLLDMPVSMLNGSPFDNFLIPGFILFTVLGIFPIIAFYGLWKRLKWAWSGAIMVSAALIIWISVEIWMVGYHSEPPLQLIYGLLGVIMLTFALLPSVRHEFHEQLNQG